MIIQCKQCATKFRFKDELMTGKGVWVRCGRCGHEFFEINPRPQEDIVPTLQEAVKATPAVSAAPEATAPPESTPPRTASRTEAAAPKPSSPAGPTPPPEKIQPVPVEEEELEENEHEEKTRTPFWTTSRLVAYSILVFLVVSGVYFWLNPGVTRDVLNAVYPGAADRVLGTVPAAPVATAGGINFAEVKERFTKSTTSGDLLVISGLAVNEYEYPVARLKLRGKVLDNTGKVLGEVETYAGNLLTDDELNRLTDKEVLAELQKPEGSDMPNTNIRSRASIPFMIVFFNPPKEIDEFIIELSGVERMPEAK